MSEEKKEETLAASPQPADATTPPVGATGVALEAPTLNTLQGAENSTSPFGLGLEHLFDVKVRVSVMLGDTKLPIETIVKLGPGSVITLDRQSTDPVDIILNGKSVAKGDVVTIGDSYGIRITSVNPANL